MGFPVSAPIEVMRYAGPNRALYEQRRHSLVECECDRCAGLHIPYLTWVTRQAGYTWGTQREICTFTGDE